MKILKKLKQKRQEKQMLKKRETAFMMYRIATVVEDAIKENKTDTTISTDDCDFAIMIKMLLTNEDIPGIHHYFRITSCCLKDEFTIDFSFKVTKETGTYEEQEKYNVTLGTSHVSNKNINKEN